MQEIIKDEVFSKYLSEYYDELKTNIPDLINYLNIINDEIFYFIELFFLNKDEIKIDYNYENKFDKNSVILEVSRMLSSISPLYEEKFLNYLKNKKIVMGNFEKSCANNEKMYIKKRNNIEDIATMIHEFFHFEHLSKYEFDMDNQDWYFLTEMIAIMFETYALLKLYNDNQYKNDIRNYFLKIIYNVYSKADGISIEAMCLNMYDKHKRVDTETFLKYKNTKQLPDDFAKLINKLISKKKEFDYHEEATYIFAYPLAVVIAFRMNEDNNYFNKVISVFENINNFSVKEVLDALEISYILSSDNAYDNLYNTMIGIEGFIKSINKNEEIKGIGVK